MLQVSTLKDQLSQEMKKRQEFISRSARAGDDINDLRNMLGSSLGNVARDPSLDPLLLDHETKKLGELVDYHNGQMPTKLNASRRRTRSPARTASPTRLGRVTSPMPSYSRPGSRNMRK